MATQGDEHVMWDWVSEDFEDGPPPSNAENDISRVEFVAREAEWREARRLVAEFRAALGEGSKVQVSEVSWGGETESVAWFARRNRLDETSFYRRAIQSVAVNEVLADFVVGPTAAGIYGIRAEIAYTLLSERRFLKGASAVEGYGSLADDVAAAWWRRVVQGRPEDFYARSVRGAWSDWFDEDGRCKETWAALDVRRHVLHVVRVSASWDE